MDTRNLTSPNGALFSQLPPRYAAFMRGLVMAVLLGAGTGGYHFLQAALPASTLAVIGALGAPLGALLIRTLEGHLDALSTNGAPTVVTTSTPGLLRVNVTAPAVPISSVAPPTVAEVVNAAAQPPTPPVDSAPNTPAS